MTELNSVEYPNASRWATLADTRHANTEAVNFIQSFFAAKNSHNVEATMEFISPDLSVYADVTLGWELVGFGGLKDVWALYMPEWGVGLSYPTRIVGHIEDGEGSVLIAFTDTPELFGGELRVFGSIDVRNHKITRWADCWDSAAMAAETYAALKRPEPEIALALRSEEAPSAERIRLVSRRLAEALSSGDVNSAANLFSYDGIFEDLALNTHVQGRNGIARFLDRVVDLAPFGRTILPGHIVGGDLGGGFEWGVAGSHPVRNGSSLIELDSDGFITRASFTYDSRNLSEADRGRLSALSVNPL
jgi:limonene-1,2-epoxide hydrolase